jgi:Phosphotransferase enzyme family
LSAARWSEPGFLARATDWIDAQLPGLGRRRSARVERLEPRPWSAVLRVPVTGGAVFFKANIPALRHEAALNRALFRLAPDCVLPVLAADDTRGWLLLPDGGTSLRTLVASPADLPLWAAALERYARFQIAAVPAAGDLLAAGAFDYRAAGLARRMAEVIAVEARFASNADSLSPAERRRLESAVPRLEELCAELSASGIPETIHHDDFHDANVLVRDDRPVFFDWHEGSVAHPFCSLLIVLRVAAHRLGLPPEDPALQALRDAYLAPWREGLDDARIGRVLGPALSVGYLCRALSWEHIVSGLPVDEQRATADGVSSWLRELAGVLATG